MTFSDFRKFSLRRGQRREGHQLRDVRIASSLRRETPSARLPSGRMSPGRAGPTREQDVLRQRQPAATS